VELHTSDQKAAGAFYADVLGWEIETNPISDTDVYLIGHKQGDNIAGIAALMTEIADHPPFWAVYLAANDVDAATAKVEAAGGKVEMEPFDVMGFGRMSALQDPSGARINLWQAGEHVGSVRANEPGAPVWNELVTPEVGKALPFYADVLGMGNEVSMAMPNGEDYIVLSDVDGKQVAGACPPPMPGLPPHWNVYFQVEDVDATVAKVGELGGSAMAPAFDVPGVGRMAVLADPQGGMFNVMSPGT
jgi:predicted enzyme related to lactoylglutathione lyase